MPGSEHAVVGLLPPGTGHTAGGPQRRATGSYDRAQSPDSPSPRQLRASQGGGSERRQGQAGGSPPTLRGRGARRPGSGAHQHRQTPGPRLRVRSRIRGPMSPVARPQPEGGGAGPAHGRAGAAQAATHPGSEPASSARSQAPETMEPPLPRTQRPRVPTR